MLITFLLYSSFSLQRPFVPLFMEENLRASIIEVGQMASALGLTGFLLAVPAGLLSAIGALVWGAALMLISVASEPYIVILSYALAGAGIVFFDTSLTALVGDLSPPHELGKSYGIYNAAIQVGFAAGPSAGAIFIILSGYREVFFVTAILPILAATLIFTIRARNSPYLLVDPAELSDVPIKLRMSGTVWTSWISIFGLGLLLAGISVLAPLYMRYNGFGEIFIGFLFLIQSLTSTLGWLLFAKLLDTSRHMWILTAGGLLLSGLSTAGFAVSASWIWLILMMGIFGIGLALAFMSASVGIVRGTSIKNRGIAMGLGSMSRFAGFMFGPWIGSTIVSTQLTNGLGYPYGFLALAFVSFIAITLIVLIGWLRRKPF
jgi:MFS family permease